MKLESYALYLAYQDPRVPRYVKVLAAVVIGLAFSPIDLIPDFIPVLGYLDDIIVVPLGVALVVRLMPEDVLAESRQRAGEMIERGEKPLSRGAAAVVVGLWLIFAAAVIFVVARVVLA